MSARVCLAAISAASFPANFTDIIKRKWALLVALHLFKMNDPLLSWPLSDRLAQDKDTPTCKEGLGDVDSPFAV